MMEQNWAKRAQTSWILLNARVNQEPCCFLFIAFFGAGAFLCPVAGPSLVLVTVLPDF